MGGQETMTRGRLSCSIFPRIRKLGIGFLASALTVLLLSPSASAAQVTLAWNGNGDPDLAGYKIYYGTASKTYDKSIKVGNVTSFTVTNLTANKYYFALTAYDQAGNESGYSNEVSWPIQLLVPGDGEILASGSPRLIEWSADRGAVQFKLWYSINNGETWIRMNEGEYIYGTESYQWEVPAPSKNKRKCLVKVAGYDDRGNKVATDKSDDTFMIEVLRMTSPNGENELVSGDPHVITWNTNVTCSPVASVKLLYTTNGGAEWHQITTLEGNPGDFLWQVPDVQKTKSQCKVKVVLKDVDGKTVGVDSSNSYFTIRPY